MMKSSSEILIVREKITPAQLKSSLALFGDMVKVVIDVEKGWIAVGGELHADAEQALMEEGSRQNHLWGANVYPGLDPENRIEFTALINIRPKQGNASMEIWDMETRRKVQSLIEERIMGPDERLV